MKFRLGYLLNPLAALGDLYNEKSGFDSKVQSEIQRTIANGEEPNIGKGIGNWISSKLNQFTNWFSQKWDDYTGISAVELQNKLERERAEENYQRNIEAIGDTKAAYESVGLNPNLMYGANPVQYEAPHLQEYSGSRKLDTILSRVGKVLSSIPMLYQATAALEGIDQARERTKQSEIKTMSMGMSLLDQGYKLGDVQLSHPFDISMFTNPLMYGQRHYHNSNPIVQPGSFYHGDYTIFNEHSLRDYADAALKNKFDLLDSIGIKNRMNSTLNNWRGYQYSLDRKFGEAGKIIGLGTSLMGGISKLYPWRLK